MKSRLIVRADKLNGGGGRWGEWKGILRVLANVTVLEEEIARCGSVRMNLGLMRCV